MICSKCLTYSSGLKNCPICGLDFSKSENVQKIDTRKTIQSPNMILVEKGVNRAGSRELDYYIGKHPVTQGEWQNVMGHNPSYFKGENKPVTNISWYDAIEYCNKRSEVEGLDKAYEIDYITIDKENRNPEDLIKWTIKLDKSKNGYRLPTFMEWLYAARGGNRSKSYVYSGSNNLDDVAWYYENSKGLQDVCLKRPNELGIFDMNGNVAEWNWNWSLNNNNMKRALGGTINSTVYTLDVFILKNIEKNSYYYNSAFPPHTLYYTIGFRVVRSY